MGEIMHPEPLLVGESNAIKKLNKLSERLAFSNKNILIEGEDGVGKVTLARQVHRLSRNREKSFVIIGLGVSDVRDIRVILLAEKSAQKGVWVSPTAKLSPGATLCIIRAEGLSFSNQITVAKFIRQKSERARIENETVEKLKKKY
jgi:DNA-binding NtrC family response regulator